MPPIGAHIQIRGGLAKGGLAYTDAVGARAVQVFVGNPRGWAPAAGDPAQDERFRSGCADDGVVAFVHAPYLVNLGSPSEVTRERSVAALRHSVRRAAAIGARGVVFHAGLALHNLPRVSLYVDRGAAQRALDARDYRILGERRPGTRY